MQSPDQHWYSDHPGESTDSRISRMSRGECCTFQGHRRKPCGLSISNNLTGSYANKTSCKDLPKGLGWEFPTRSIANSQHKETLRNMSLAPCKHVKPTATATLISKKSIVIPGRTPLNARTGLGVLMCFL